MGTLKEDINEQANWIVKAFAADGLKLDFTIRSFIEIDRFFIKHSFEGKPKKGGRLASNLGPIIFSIGAYIGNFIINNVPGSIWETDDEAAGGELTISIKLPDNSVIWPVQRVMKRFKNGLEDSIYVYGHEITKSWTKEEFDSNYWDKVKEKKEWWKFGK
jgi:hypothetical protein